TPFAPQHVGGPESGRAASGDTGRRGTAAGRRGRRWTGELLSNEQLAVDALDAPARDRIERRRANGVAGREAETGVMQWAANGVADDQPVREQTVIVSAVRRDGEKSIAGPREKDVVFADAADEHLAVGERVRRRAGREIRLRSVWHDP